MSKISNKVCIITGGGGGIGRSLCEELAAAGASGVYVVDIDIASAKKVAESLPSLASHPNFRYGFDVADVGKEDDIKRIIHSAWSLFGVVDAYFSNAGIFTAGGVSESEVSNEAWNKIWNINVMSHIFGARHLFPLWEQSNHKGGIFVITGSAAGVLMQIGCLPYSLTKHAAVSIAEWLAVHHPDVSVFCLCPQAVNTNMLTSSVKSGPAKDISAGDVPAGVLAGLGGVKEPNDVAIATIKGIDDGTFLILPHPEVKKFFLRKATDYDRWIKGMQVLKGQFDQFLAKPPTRSKL
jgi:NAD(P)-dependent dehydrogenase (short-subunit alcohol dehydrogenase family)